MKTLGSQTVPTSSTYSLSTKDRVIDGGLYQDSYTPPFYDARNYGLLSTAISQIGSTVGTLLISTAQVVTADMTIPTTLSLNIIKGGYIAISSGKVLTIDGTLNAGLYQIFAGSGSVVFGNNSVSEVYPQWWGGLADSNTDQTAYITSALNTNLPVCVTTGTWKCNITINNLVGAKIYGSGMNSILKTYDNSSPVITINSTSVQTVGTQLSNFTIDGNSLSVGIYMLATTPWIVHGSVIKELYIHHCKKGIYINSGTIAEEVYFNIFENIRIYNIPNGTSGAHNHGIYSTNGVENIFRNIDIAYCGDYSYAIENWGTSNSFYDVVVDGPIRSSGANCNWYSTSIETIYATTPVTTYCAFRCDGNRATILGLNIVNVTNAKAGNALAIWNTNNSISKVNVYGTYYPDYAILLDTTSSGTLSDVEGGTYNIYASASSAIRENWTISNIGNSSYVLVYPVIATLANSATPAIYGEESYLTGGTTTITNITGGHTSKVIRIISEHNITITDGTNIYLNSSANFVMKATDTLTLIKKADGKWYELSRSVN